MSATGAWSVIIESPLGKQTREMTIAATTNAFTGTVAGPDGVSAIAGQIEGDKLMWSDKVSKPMPLSLQFEVKLDGDKMTGVVKLGIFGKAKFSATRKA